MRYILAWALGVPFEHRRSLVHRRARGVLKARARSGITRTRFPSRKSAERSARPARGACASLGSRATRRTFVAPPLRRCDPISADDRPPGGHHPPDEEIPNAPARITQQRRHRRFRRYVHLRVVRSGLRALRHVCQRALLRRHVVVEHRLGQIKGAGACGLQAPHEIGFFAHAHAPAAGVQPSLDSSKAPTLLRRQRGHAQFGPMKYSPGSSRRRSGP